jgi:dihydrofolate synthase/folylpolyglutamate synthase
LPKQLWHSPTSLGVQGASGGRHREVDLLRRLPAFGAAAHKDSDAFFYVYTTGEDGRSNMITYPEAIQFLNSLSRFGWRLGLDRMDALCERLGHPEHAFDIVHVAGTNGKGSTSTYLAGILQAAGYRTGLYTSPHLYDGRERIKVDGEMITEAEVCDLVDILLPHVRRVQHIGEVTEFEAWTALMFMHFERKGVRVAVVEAGLGGRWDATNIAWPRLAVITNVSLDHVDRLGTTVSEIARDKAGIIIAGSKVVVGGLSQEARAEIETEARLVGARVYSVVPMHDSRVSVLPDSEPYFPWELLDDGGVRFETLHGQHEVLPYVGPRYQARNAVLAVAAAHILDAEDGYRITPEALQIGLSHSVPGRFEIVCEEPEVILDAAHNPAAAAVLASELARGRVTPRPANADPGEPPAPRLRIVFGSSAGHDGEACLRILSPLATEVFLTRARNPRSRDPQELAAAVRVPFEIIPDVASAVETAVRRSRPHDRVVVTGSFFVLGESPRVFRHGAGQ